MGLSTALVTCPHHAVTILLEQTKQQEEEKKEREKWRNCTAAAANLKEDVGGREGEKDTYVQLMLGIHPQQEEAEARYRMRYRGRKGTLAFIHSCLSFLHPSSLGKVEGFLREKEGAVLREEGREGGVTVVEEVITLIANECPENRRESLEKEAARQLAR